MLTTHNAVMATEKILTWGKWLSVYFQGMWGGNYDKLFYVKWLERMAKSGDQVMGVNQVVKDLVTMVNLIDSFLSEVRPIFSKLTKDVVIQRMWRRRK
jgi:hypothetical protein